MACNLLRIRTSGVAVNTTALVITIPEVTLTNGQVFRLCLAQSIPSSAAVTQVYLYDGTTYIPVYEPSCMSGNYVRADQLRGLSSILMVYGNDPVHASVLSGMKQSCYSVIYPNGAEAACTVEPLSTGSTTDSTTDSTTGSVKSTKAQA